MAREQILTWLVPVFLIFIITLISIRRNSTRVSSCYRPGSIYSVIQGDVYQVIKVIAVDSKVVHVRLYKNQFIGRPYTVDVNELSLGTINDPDGFGIGHLPISYKSFFRMQPEFIAQSEDPSGEELEGYNIWKESRANSAW